MSPYFSVPISFHAILAIRTSGKNARSKRFAAVCSSIDPLDVLCVECGVQRAHIDGGYPNHGQANRL